MPRVVQSILKRFPGLKILLLTQPRTLTYELLQQGRIDFAVVLSDCRPDGFKVVDLKREPLCLVAFSKHRLAKKKVIQPKQIDKIPFIAGIKSNGHSEMIDQICERSGLSQYSPAFQISTLQGRKEAAKAGLGVTVLPRFVVQSEVKNKSFTQLRIKGIRLASAAIMLVKPIGAIPRANVDLVKKLVEENIRKTN